MTIDTAPKNGTEILAWREDAGWMICRWTAPIHFLTEEELTQYGAKGDDTCNWYYADFMTGGILEGDEAPTHWMPIPADPSGKLPE